MMAKEAVLSGVAHNIAHHARSGFSSLSPYLARVLLSARLRTTQIDLLSEQPYPKNVALDKPLSLSLAALHSKAEKYCLYTDLAFSKYQNCGFMRHPPHGTKLGTACIRGLLSFPRKEKLMIQAG